MNSLNPMRKKNNRQPAGAMASAQEPVYLDTRGAAAFLGLSPRTLDRYRKTGQGPEHFRFGGRVRYLKSDVAAWASARRVKSGPGPDLGDRPV